MGVETTSQAALDVEASLEAYERCQAERGHANLAEFLPPPDQPNYVAVLRELVRVDLEYSWEQGSRTPLAAYLQRFPELANDRHSLQEISFEEYRLRQQAGEQPSPAEYQRRFGVSTRHWPMPLSPVMDEPPAPGNGLPALEAVADPYLEQLRLAQAAKQWPAVGTRFLDFELLQELGQGAFGRVFLARQGDLASRFVALKVAGELQVESQTLAQLQHTNIVPIYSAHESGAFRAVCMPYFGATTVADVLRALHTLPTLPQSGAWLVQLLKERQARVLTVTGRPETAVISSTWKVLESRSYAEAILWLATRLAEGLAHAHERGIVHRDLKPANVLLSDDGQPMLLDFNLSEDTKSAAGATAAAYLGGTLPYMAPEQLAAFCHNQPGGDVRSDLYALGLVFYELLTGRYPFPLPGATLAGLLPPLIAARRGPPPQIRPWNKQVSPALEAILRRCLEPQPHRRYGGARQLLEDLECQAAHLPLKHVREPSVKERVQKWSRRHPRLVSSYSVAAAALLLLAPLLSLYLARSQQLARSESLAALHQFQDEYKTSRFLLSGPAPTPEELQEGIAVARRALDRFQVMDNSEWPSTSPARLLPAETREPLQGDAAELLLFLSRAQRLSALAESDTARRSELLAKALELNQLAGAYAPSEAAGPVWKQRALLLEILGQTNDAAILLNRAESLPPRSARDHYQLAAEQLGLAEYAQALPLLRAAARQDPQDAYIHYALGLCYAGLADSQRALAAFDTSVALWPRFHGSYYHRGGAHAQLKEYDQALADFEEALRLRPNYLPAYLDRALVKMERKDFAGAIADVSHALESGAAPTRAYFMRARIKAQAGDVAGARRDQQQGLKQLPADELSWVARGVARLSFDPRGALADFEEALKLNPRSKEALQDKAHVLAEYLGKTAEAIAVLDQAVARYPDYVEARAGRGVLHGRLGHRDAALRDAEEALHRDTRPATQYQVAGIYALTSKQHPDDRGEAFRLLAAALRGGYGFELLAVDHDLDAVRALPEFRRLVEAAKALRSNPGQAPR